MALPQPIFGRQDGYTRCYCDREKYGGGPCSPTDEGPGCVKLFEPGIVDDIDCQPECNGVDTHWTPARVPGIPSCRGAGTRLRADCARHYQNRSYIELHYLALGVGHPAIEAYSAMCDACEGQDRQTVHLPSSLPLPCGTR